MFKTHTGVANAVRGELRTKEKGNDTPTLQEEFQQVLAEYKATTAEIKRFATDTQREIKETGELSRATKEAVDKALAKQGELQARLSEVEQKLAKAIKEAGAPTPPASVGQQFTDSEEFKALVKAGRGIARVSVKAITNLTPAAGGLLVYPQQLPLVAPPRRPYHVRSLLAPGRTSSNAIIYARELTRVNNAASVPEGGAKPESTATWESITEGVKTLAHWMLASKQILDDVPYLQSYIDNILLDGLMDVEDLQLLKGSGTGNDLEGLVTAATAYAAPIVVATPTKIDQLRLAILQSTLTNHTPSGIVMHPSDWASIELTKDSQGRYIFVSATDPTGASSLWGLPVVQTVAMDLDEFLVGPFRTGAQILDREDANVQVSTEDRDNFIKNMVTVRAEERLALAIYFPAAFITGAFV
jgi:HK97 family phage major capsid protein